jgi:hypothetical protein
LAASSASKAAPVSAGKFFFTHSAWAVSEVDAIGVKLSMS